MVAMTLNSINELAKDVLDIEAKAILRLKNNIGDDFDKAVDILYNCKGRVIVTGMGKSGLIGKKIAATMGFGRLRAFVSGVSRRESGFAWLRRAHKSARH